ncbi:MAG TPA: hypothetical protein VK421_08735 [Pyrinomonadaceae bacterium]|nr:hypothetical protein [Pyrinomonadaceae bacterium]
MKKAVFALSLVLLFALAASAQTTRNLTLSQGDTITPASPVTDATGATTYYGGFVNARVEGTSPGVATFSLAFRDAGLVDPLGGVYSGAILAPNSSFAVTETVGRKSQSTSGTIDAGTVTYRLAEDGRAEIISIVSDNLTIWEGKNRKRTAVGSGSIDYGTAAPGAGTLTLVFNR